MKIKGGGFEVEEKTTKVFEIRVKYGSPWGEIDFDWLAHKLNIGKRRIMTAIQKVLDSDSDNWKEEWLKQRGMMKECPPLVRIYKIGDEIFISEHTETGTFSIPLTDESTFERRRWVKEYLKR